jgi:hypothetical protein
MRKFAVTLMASLLSSSAVFAFWPEATDSSLEVGVGYRQDRLEWKTSSHFDSSYSGYSGGSDYYGYDGDSFYNDDEFLYGVPARASSHLKWKDLNIWQIEAKGKYITCDNLYLRANADYGWITSGKNTDRDFVQFDGYDNSYAPVSGSEVEFARSHSKVKGHVYDVKLAVGYQFKLCDDSFSIAPLIGYSWHGQHLEDRHLRQSFISDDETYFTDGFDTTGTRSYYYYSDYYGSDSYDVDSYCYDYSSYSYGGNHSKYHTRWNGPFIGFDFDYRFGCCCEWDLFGGYEFHWAQYDAKGKWELRSDLLNGFHHRAKDAYGSVFDIGVKWDFCECWTLAVKGEFQWWWADHGRDRALIAEGRLGDVKTDCHISMPLRDVKWQSASISVDLGMVF